MTTSPENKKSTHLYLIDTIKTKKLTLFIFLIVSLIVGLTAFYVTYQSKTINEISSYELHDDPWFAVMRSYSPQKTIISYQAFLQNYFNQLGHNWKIHLVQKNFNTYIEIVGKDSSTASKYFQILRTKFVEFNNLLTTICQNSSRCYKSDGTSKNVWEISTLYRNILQTAPKQNIPKLEYFYSEYLKLVNFLNSFIILKNQTISLQKALTLPWFKTFSKNVFIIKNEAASKVLKPRSAHATKTFLFTSFFSFMFLCFSLLIKEFLVSKEKN